MIVVEKEIEEEMVIEIGVENKVTVFEVVVVGYMSEIVVVVVVEIEIEEIENVVEVEVEIVIEIEMNFVVVIDVEEDNGVENKVIVFEVVEVDCMFENVVEIEIEIEIEEIENVEVEIEVVEMNFEIVMEFDNLIMI